VKTTSGKEPPVLADLLHANSRKPRLALVIAVLLSLYCLVSAQSYTLEEGKRLLDDRKFEEAKEVLLKVIDREPENPEANFVLCKVYLMLDDHDNSLKYGKKAVELDGSQSDYHLWLGQAHGMQAQEGSKLKAIFRAKRAKGEFEKAVELDSTSMEARLALMEYLISAPGIAGGDKKEALAHAEIVEKMDPLYGAYARGVWWHREKDFDKAEAYLRKAAELDTTSNYWVTYRVGFLLQEQEKYHQAAEVFEELYNKHPDEPGALYQIGRTYVLAKDSLVKAERCFKQYLQMEPKKGDPDWAAAHWRLGMVYDLQGKTDLAIVELEEAVRLAPKKKDYQKTLKEVKKKK
jgi:tetratricopeptide (TPR) repeat protein